MKAVINLPDNFIRKDCYNCPLYILDPDYDEYCLGDGRMCALEDEFGLGNCNLELYDDNFNKIDKK